MGDPRSGDRRAYRRSTAMIHNVVTMCNGMVGASGSVSVQEFTRVCDQVDGEAEAALSGVFAQHRSWVMAMAYVAALCRDDVPVKTCWDLSQAAGLTRPCLLYTSPSPRDRS